MSNVTPHIERLVGEMLKAEDKKKAVNMAAYLKDQFACFGIKAPVRNQIQRKWFAEIKDAGLDHWDVVYNLWALDEREFHYIAIDYLKRLPKKKYQKDDYKCIEELIISKSWWDSVDGLATNIAGAYFQAFPEMIDPVITKWRNSDNMWLNRTCLIFQLKYKENIDFNLLKDLILQFLPVKEFFIQKAIGWSLRQHSKIDPDAVRKFVEDLDLSTVAKREAYKYI
jgi:3-methyladenine DNA glycosylase AlkD